MPKSSERIYINTQENFFYGNDGENDWKVPFFTTQKALELGMLNAGREVICNGDWGRTTDHPYIGKIYDISTPVFGLPPANNTLLTISRYDGRRGSGSDDQWGIFTGDFNYIGFTVYQYSKQEKRCRCGKLAIGKIDGQYLCKSCVADIPQCEICGRLYLPISSYSQKVCGECFDNFYTHCRECGIIHEKEKQTDGFCILCFERTKQCCKCRKHYMQNDLIYIQTSNEYFCNHCYDIFHFGCQCCGQTFPIEMQIEVETPIGRGLVCKKCREHKFTFCSNCKKLEYSSIIKIRNQKVLCHVCANLTKPKIISTIASPAMIKDMKRLLNRNRCEELKRLNFYSQTDAHIKEIVYTIGIVKSPIYLYGLSVEHIYSIVCSKSLLKYIDLVETLPIAKWDTQSGNNLPIFQKTSYYIKTPLGQRELVIGKETIASNILTKFKKKPLTLGISYELRTEHRAWVCNFIKQINERIKQ